MRKAIIAAIVATALFAFGAFAASFAVEAEDVASGSNSVDRCAERVQVEFGDGEWSETDGVYQVTSFTVFLRDGATGTALTDDCDGKAAEVAISMAGATNDVEYDELVVGSGAATGTIVVQDIALAAKDITGVAVLVEDIYLDGTGQPITVPVP